jgi:predicted acetyltransferase
VLVDVSPAPASAKPVIRRLLELNAHDFSAIDGRDLGPHGEYGYPYLDHYWTEAGWRQPYLVTADGRIAGCALVRLGDPNEFGEFFVVRKYRRAGVGTAAARSVLRRHPGTWSVHQLPGNDGAVAFWRRAIPVGYTELSDTTGTTQRFVLADACRP